MESPSLVELERETTTEFLIGVGKSRYHLELQSQARALRVPVFMVPAAWCPP
jgi:hypothetical protein